MLKVNNIEVIYNEVILALKGVSLQVEDGQIVALLGSNGAGKSTTLKAISGLLRTELGAVTGGSIELNGARIEHRDPVSIVRMGTVQVMEGRRVLEHLTVEENLMVGAQQANGSLAADLDKVLTYFPRLRQLYKRESGYLSGGEQQMLVIGRGLMAHPKLMLLDEPSLGLSPLLVAEIFQIIARINREEKMAILLVEQNATLALGIAHFGYVMENGRVVLDGAADKLRENEDIKEFYLGLTQVGARKSYRAIKHYKRRKRWLG